MVPQPVTTPSPGTLSVSMPKSVQRCSTYMSNSSNEPVVEQELDPLARGELAALVLGVDAGLAAAHAGLGAAHFKLFEDFLHSTNSPTNIDTTASSQGPHSA